MKKIVMMGMLACWALNISGQMTDDLLEQELENAFSIDLQEEVIQTEDTVWWTGGLFALNFSQVSFSNWAAGGVNSISGVALANFYAKMKKGKSTWDNTLDLAFGLLDQKNLDVVKTDDKIDLASKYGYQAWNEKWYYSALLNFKTQFAEGENIETGERISDFMAPGYVLFSMGLDHKPNEKLSFFVSPITAKWTIVNDQNLADAGAFGVQGEILELDGTGTIVNRIAGENSRSEYGAYARVQFQDDIMENVSFMTRLELFENYETAEYVDINWEALLGFKVNKYISCTLGTQAIYDHDVLILKEGADDSSGNPTQYFGRAVQFKEVFNLGFLYNF